MHLGIKHQRSRTCAGMSLIEMLSAMFIMTFVGAAITDLCVSQNVVAYRATSKLNGIVNSRRAIAMFDHDIRMASSFPSTYTPSSAAPGDNSVATWPTPSPSYVVNEQTLIVEEPDFASDGYPKEQNKTVIYKVLPDKRTPGKGLFVLQKMDFSIPNSEPQTILTGIVGPINQNVPNDPVSSTPPPMVFGRLNRLTPLYISKGVVPETFNLDALTHGVSCCLEVFDNSGSSQSMNTPKTIAFKREIYARGNYAVNP